MTTLQNPDPLAAYLRSTRYGVHDMLEKHPCLKPFYCRISRKKWLLYPEKQLEKRRIMRALRAVTGRSVKHIQCVDQYHFSHPSVKLRRVWWLDVEEHLEGQLDPKWRTSHYGSVRSLQQAATLSFAPLAESLYQSFGNNLVYFGAPTCSIAEAIRYCLTDYVLLHYEGHSVLWEARERLNNGLDSLEDAVRYLRLWLEELCYVLDRCILLGEDCVQPGNWFVLCAPPF